ncbi:hypothetical protein ACV3VQ_07160 [Clostridium perfringens]|uniref:hypothetical protein n=2 Tax=Clostridium perfringens TaxID=1502 RepID=UPI002A185EF3|nr:hypothetical protein [Clostridium perfringens]MDK0764997.1 hypothetical protein [Clostridium perfringens]MDM0742138.1 hypothetical protein [Clostridium perfringens]MDZ5024826.1 hypothetical protein [Clostridium perfringens]MDZ5040358.1 hypothetical protein [Clostridium perfringens]
MKIKKRYVENRNGDKIEINNYIVDIDESMRERCWNFSKKIIEDENQFNRMLPENITSEEEEKLIRIQRTYAGKLAEYAFLKFLQIKGKEVTEGDMLTIYEGQKNVDNFDFITRDNSTVDIKAAFKENHRNLVVNLEQLNNIPKDFYVGIKLNSKNYNNNLINPDSITEAEIFGYCECEYLNKRTTVNLGEDFCKTVNLGRLIGIDNLLKKF